MKRKPVDEKSYELAMHFLSGTEYDNEGRRQELAEMIQGVVEDYFFFDLGGSEPGDGKEMAERELNAAQARIKHLEDCVRRLSEPEMDA